MFSREQSVGICRRYFSAGVVGRVSGVSLPLGTERVLILSASVALEVLLILIPTCATRMRQHTGWLNGPLSTALCRPLNHISKFRRGEMHIHNAVI